MNQDSKRADRFNKGKIRYDLLPPYAIDQLARVMTMGAEKYGPNNWQKGMPWTEVLASAKRHIAKIEEHEDYDSESNLLHAAHVMANAAFLVEYYKNKPQFDDRLFLFNDDDKIVLDIDEVVCDFIGGYCARYNTNCSDHKYWNFSFKTPERMAELNKDKEFWLNLPVLREVPFEPHAYVTSRDIPTEWTQEWLEKNNLPCSQVITVGAGQSKVPALKELGATIMVDDSFKNFKDITNSGIFCYLMDAPHNQCYNVGYRRISDLHILNY